KDRKLSDTSASLLTGSYHIWAGAYLLSTGDQRVHQCRATRIQLSGQAARPTQIGEPEQRGRHQPQCRDPGGSFANHGGNASIADGNDGKRVEPSMAAQLAIPQYHCRARIAFQSLLQLFFVPFQKLL